MTETTVPATTTDETDIEYRPCEALVYRATLVDPEEYCDNDALDGSDFCARHTEPEEPDYEPDWDDHYADYDFSREE